MKIKVDQILSTNRKVQDDSIKRLYLYCIPRIEQMIQGNEMDIQADDIFQDSMAILYLNLKNDKFNSESSLETYAISICKNTWLYKLRTKLNQEKRNSAYNEVNEVLNMEQALNLAKVSALLNRLTGDCIKILTSFYYHKKSMTQIGSELGINEQSAKNKKNRCMKKLTEIVRSEKLRITDFFN